MNQQNTKVSSYTKPKRKMFKAILLTIAIVLIGVGSWVGITAYKAIKNVTALSTGGNNSLFSLFNKNTTLKGQSDGRTNILLLGMGGKNHPGGTLTDSLMVISINWKTNQMALVSVPRDLYVDIPGHGYSKINEAYSSGEKSSGGGGGNTASDVISEVLGIPIHYFISMDFDGFTKIINTVGGIDIDVPKAINDPLYPASDMIHYDPFYISAGQHHMDGATALKYARSRETTSDFDRSKRQQQVLAATKQKILSLNVLANPAKVSELLNAIGDHMRTNLSVSEIKSLWDEIKNIDMSTITNKVFDTSSGSPLVSSTSSGGAYIIIPKKGMGNYTELQEIVKNIFSEATNSNPKIEILNGSGKTATATSVTNTLKANNYSVSNTEKTTLTETTTVYNCSGTTTSAASKKIAELLGAAEKTKNTCNDIDIQIIIGQSSNSN